MYIFLLVIKCISYHSFGEESRDILSHSLFSICSNSIASCLFFLPIAYCLLPMLPQFLPCCLLLIACCLCIVYCILPIAPALKAVLCTPGPYALASIMAFTRTGFNSSVNLSYSFNDRLRSNFGMTYHSYEFERPELIDLAEVMKTINLGINYRLYSNVDLNARYSYISMESDDLFRDFVRHRISAGMNIKF